MADQSAGETMKFPLPGCTGRRVLVISQGAMGFWAQAVNLKGLDDYDNLVGGLEHFFPYIYIIVYINSYIYICMYIYICII